MCGLAGFLSRGFADDAARRALEAMTACLAHRGPDGSGLWCDARAGIALGHRRLAVIDLSEEGRQPMVSRSGRSVVVYNGEIYNHRELRAALERDGAAGGWRGHSDTETMLEAIEKRGLEPALQAFNGMFAFALWQRDERRLVLARDRLGEKPLYYGYCGKTFLFGSELKALRRHPEWQAEIDRGALALFLRFGYVPAPYSIYRGIRKLLPGTCLALDRAALAQGRLPEPSPYWQAKKIAEEAEAQPFAGGLEEAARALESLLADAVGLRLEADVPLGAFLSGGIDSSAIVALMQKASARPVRTFTIGFHDKRLDEAPYARAIAARLGTEHTEVYAGEKDALALVPRLPEIYDEPFADISQLPTILLSEITRRHVTVALSGDGGDELFGGYPRYARSERAWRRIRRVPAPLRAALAGFAHALPAALDEALAPLAFARRLPRPAARLKRRLAEWGAASPEDYFKAQLSQWRELAPGALVPGATSLPTLFESPERQASLADPLRRFMYCDALHYLPDDILVKVDRASMAFGLEARIPLLDHRVVAFAWSLPPAARREKGVLRRVLERHLPRELIERPKTGFEPPLASWLRGALRDWADELLSESNLKSDGYLAPKPFRARWREHREGARNGQLALWPALVFLAWRRAGG